MALLALGTDEVYECHRADILRVLGRKCGWLASDEREALFQDAVMVMLEKERSGELDVASLEAHHVRAYLLRTAIHKALDEGKRAERRRTVPMPEEPILAAIEGGESTDERLQTEFQRARFEEILAEMPDRRSAIIKLRYFFDRTPHEVQVLLNISSRAYRKELEAGLQELGQLYTVVRDGKWCERRRSAILAMMAGIAGPNRARLAQQHLRSCPGCARWVADLRAGAEAAAAVLPVPWLVLDTGERQKLVESAEVLRDSAFDLGWDVKQRALGVLGRSDPTVLTGAAGARPGAAAAALSACLALGGGATYCVVEGIPEPLRPGTLHAARDEPKQERRAREAPRPEPLATVAATPVPTVTATPTRDVPARSAAPRARSTTASASKRPAPVKLNAPRTAAEQQEERRATAPEFGLEGSGTPVTAPAPAPAPAPSTPPVAPVAPPPSTPAPSGPPGEFDP